MKLLLRLAYRAMQLGWFLTRPVTLGVRLLPIQGDTVLLVRHSYQDAWFLPGVGVKRKKFLLAGEPDHEIERAGFFPLDLLPEELSPGSRRRIEGYQRGDLPAYGIW